MATRKEGDGKGPREQGKMKLNNLGLTVLRGWSEPQLCSMLRKKHTRDVLERTSFQSSVGQGLTQHVLVTLGDRPGSESWPRCLPAVRPWTTDLTSLDSLPQLLSVYLPSKFFEARMRRCTHSTVVPLRAPTP